MDRLGIDEFRYEDSTYTRGKDEAYEISDLIALAKKEKPFDLDLRGIDIGIMPWGNQDIKSFCYHVKRMNKVDDSFPVILDDTGFVCDGWHRVAKAIIEGAKTIKAVRLQVMPNQTVK